MNVTVAVCDLTNRVAVEALAKTDPATKDFPYLWRRYRNWEESNARPIVAFVDGDLLGFHAAVFGKTYVNSYYQLTHPSIRGQGVGGIMVEKLLALAHELGCSRLKFKVPKGSDGQRFWEGFGLRAFGEDDHHYVFDVSLVGVSIAADLGQASRQIPDKYLRQYERYGVVVTDCSVSV